MSNAAQSRYKAGRAGLRTSLKTAKSIVTGSASRVKAQRDHRTE